MSEKKSEQPSEELREEIFGATEKVEATKNFVISPDVIRQPLVESGAVARACCLGCGYCLEIMEDGAKHLAELAKAEIPDSWEGYYFEAQRCLACDKDYKNVALKKI